MKRSYIIPGDELGLLKLSRIKPIPIGLNGLLDESRNPSKVLCRSELPETPNAIVDICVVPNCQESQSSQDAQNSSVSKLMQAESASNAVIVSHVDGSVRNHYIDFDPTSSSQSAFQFVPNSATNFDESCLLKALNSTRKGRALAVGKKTGKASVVDARNLNIVKEFKTRGPVGAIGVSEDASNFATGGKENDLLVFDVEKGKETFRAINLPHDKLDLRKPVWITGLSFLSSKDLIVTCTGYSEMRIYDIRDSTSNCRPIKNIDLTETHHRWGHFTCLKYQKESNSIFLTDNQGSFGRMNLDDFKFDAKFKGAAGSIRSIDLHQKAD